MQGVSVTKALGAGIAAVVAMFALWGALFAVQPAYAADENGLSAGALDISTTVAQPKKPYIRCGESLKIDLEQTVASVKGEWTIEVSGGTELVSYKIANPKANKTKLTITGVKAGTATIKAKFTADSGASDMKTRTVVVKGATPGKVIVGKDTGIKYKVLDAKKVAVLGVTKAARSSKKSVNIPDTVMLAGNGEKINKTDSYNGPKNYRAKYTVVKINPYALHKMTKVTSITVGNNVYHIGTHAFCDNKSLTKLTLGTSVKIIEPFIVHQGVSKLKVITVKSTKLTNLTNMLKDNKSVKTIKVPSSKKAAYTKLFKKCGKTVKVTA